MPPTTGGSTSGNSTNGRDNRTTRASLRASTSAIGTPNSTHSAVLAAAVFRLSSSAVTEDGLAISGQKCAQSTFTATATSGKTTNAAPIPAGTYTQPGRPFSSRGRPTATAQGLPKPAASRIFWPEAPVSRSTNSCASPDRRVFLSTATG